MVGVEFWGPWVSKVQVHNLYGHFLEFAFLKQKKEKICPLPAFAEEV